MSPENNKGGGLVNGNGIGKDEVEESSRKVLQVHEALGPQHFA